MVFEDDSAWLDARIEKVEALIVAYEDAILALGTDGGMQSYTLDTGQSRQTVTRQDLGSLRLQLESLENRRSVLKARRNGASFNARPGF